MYALVAYILGYDAMLTRAVMLLPMVAMLWLFQVIGRVRATAEAMGRVEAREADEEEQ